MQSYMCSFFVLYLGAVGWAKQSLAGIMQNGSKVNKATKVDAKKKKSTSVTVYACVLEIKV